MPLDKFLNSFKNEKWIENDENRCKNSLKAECKRLPDNFRDQMAFLTDPVDRFHKNRVSFHQRKAMAPKQLHSQISECGVGVIAFF